MAGDAARQAGMSVGTDKGLSVDPSSFPESFVGGAATAGTLGAPKLAAEATRAYALRKYGGENTEATKNYATRLEAAGEGGLGNAKRDARAHETVKTDLKNELRNAAAGVRKSTELAPDVDNALQRAQSGDHLTPKDIALIEGGTASAPDGANAAYLARTLRIAQLAQGTGSYRGDKWAGGISGALDKNVLPYLNPLRSMTGLAASGLGIHTLGVSTPPVAAGLIGAYGASRIVDMMAGTRSPAKTFAKHFADRQAQLRLPQTPATPQAPAASSASTASPANPAAGPWGPKPSAVTSVPQVPAGGASRDAAGAMLDAVLLKKAMAKASPAKAEADPATSAVDHAKALAGIAHLKANSKPEGDTTARNPYEPLPEEHLYPQDISPEAYAAAEAHAYLGPHVPLGRRASYMAQAENSARHRIAIANTMKAKYPSYWHAFDGLLRQLHKTGGKQDKALDAIHHYANFLPDAVGRELIEAFR